MRAVDLFAGWGGFTLGAEQAGATVVWAANHWAVAVQAHALNHPDVEHACQDLRQADWTALPEYDLLLASPACQGHSSASQPRRRGYHDALRATAWAVVDCADVTEPRALVVENVPAFRRWRLYDVWTQALESLGYTLTEHTLRASDFGVPQRRNRLFIVGTLNGAAIELPEPTPEPSIGPSIEWGTGRWRPVVGAARNARIRMERGREKHGARFLTQHVTGHPGVPLTQAMRTITTKDQWAVVDGSVYRPLTRREYARGMGFPDSYRWPAGVNRTLTIKGLGNAVCPPVAKAVVGAIARAA